MNYQKQHSLIDDNLLKELEKDSYNLKQRKQLVQTMINGLTNEMNSNVSVYNKLKGTPLLFTSSTFHLVHVSSLKFLALDDENLEDLRSICDIFLGLISLISQTTNAYYDSIPA